MGITKTFFILPQYLVFWLLSCDHTVWWNPVEFYNFCFELYFLVHVHTKASLCWLPMYIPSYTIMPPFVLLSSKFATFTPYMRYSLYVVLIFVLHISRKLSMYVFSSPFIFSSFFLSFLEFFRVNCSLICYSSAFPVYSSKSILPYWNTHSWTYLWFLVLYSVILQYPHSSISLIFSPLCNSMPSVDLNFLLFIIITPHFLILNSMPMSFAKDLCSRH